MKRITKVEIRFWFSPEDCKVFRANAKAKGIKIKEWNANNMKHSYKYFWQKMNGARGWYLLDIEKLKRAGLMDGITETIRG